MPRCKYCNQLNPPKQSFQDPEHLSNYFCNEEHLKLYNESKSKKQSDVKAIQLQAKSKKPVSDMRKLTDYIQQIWPSEPNWQWFTKQIKSLAKETGLCYNDMRMTIKYCVEYLGMEPDGNYGLQQFIPRYAKEAMDFGEDIKRIKSQLESIDFEDEIVSVPIGKVRLWRPIKEDLGFDS